VKLNYIFSVIVVAMVVIGDIRLTKLADLLIKDILTKMQQDGQRKSVYRKRRYWQNEIDTFFEYPIFGAGVGKGEIRKKTNRNFVLSHDEITQNAR
jgi:hypothetical protein